MSNSLVSVQPLIPPDNRASFVTAYVFLTVLLWVLFGAFFSLSSVIPNITVSSIAEAMVIGLSVGLGQWLALRAYVPAWTWVGATAIGSGLATLTQHLWYRALLQTAQQPDASSLLAPLLQTPLGIILPVQLMTILAFCIWLAGAQWLVLRRYVRKATVWWFTPAIAMGLTWISLLLQLGLYLGFRQPFLSSGVLFPGMLAAVQALLLCRFHRTTPTEDPEPAGTKSVSGVGLAIATFSGVLVLSMSMQGFLIWFGAG